MRLGLLQDTAAIERQIAREAAEAKAKRARLDIPTVKTEVQTKAEEISKEKEKERITEKVKQQTKPRIRPLTEAKAIDSGANFISETFLFSVGLSLIVFETWRSRRKENSRRSDVADKLADLEAKDLEKDKKLQELERELAALRSKDTHTSSSSSSSEKKIKDQSSSITVS